MEKLLRTAEMRDLEKQVTKGEISYSRMVEIINEKHFMSLINLRQELSFNKVNFLEEVIKVMKQSYGIKYFSETKFINGLKELLRK